MVCCGGSVCLPRVSDDDVVEGLIDAAEAREADLDYHAVERCGRRNVILGPTLKDQACLVRSDEREGQGKAPSLLAPRRRRATTR